MSALLEKICPNCGKDFKTYRSVNKKCCSRACSQARQKAQSYEKYKANCLVCGEEFLPPRQAEGGKYCSYACSGLALRKSRVDRNGYWHVCVDDHPRRSSQGYVPEHTLIMEAHIGRYLADDEVVHHIDHNGKNNAIENLQLMTDAEHRALHMREAHDAGKVSTKAQRKRAAKRMRECNPSVGMRRDRSGKFMPK